MADNRMAALELLRKAAADGDLDFLREGLTMLTQLERQSTAVLAMSNGAPPAASGTT